MFVILVGMNTLAVFVMLLGAAMTQTVNYCNVKTCGYFQPSQILNNALCLYKVG